MSSSREAIAVRELVHEQTYSFQELRHVDQFFEPESGEFFEKVGDTQGRFLTGGDYFQGEIVEFEPTAPVQYVRSSLAQERGRAGCPRERA